MPLGMNLRHLVASLALVPVAVAAGCGSEYPLEEDIASTRHSLLTDPTSDRTPHNGLNPDTLALNTDILQELEQSTASLEQTLKAPSFAGRFGDPNTNKLIEDIVSCALDKDHLVHVEPFKWQGELGICDNTDPSSPFGKWSSTGPTVDCLQAVSACVLSRMNKLNKQVPISIRGQNANIRHANLRSGPFPELLEKVRVETTFHDRSSILSESGCASGGSGDPTRNCGWEMRFVGICRRNEKVNLQLIDTSADAAAMVPASAMVRVCKGLYGCDHNQADLLLPSPLPPALPYAGYVQDFKKGDPITFTCPPNVGTAPSDSPYHTYFSVMVAPENPNDSIPEIDVMPNRSSAFIYPAAEEEVFTYREGAFYGQIFPLGKNLFGERYACYSEGWKTGKAHLASRLCAAPPAAPGAPDCFLSQEPYPCLDTPLSMRSDPPLHDHLCAGASAAPEQAYSSCAGPAQSSGLATWTRGVTVFLNDPCDLASDATSCTLECAHSECTTGVPLRRGCSPVVTSVCDVDPFCCDNISGSWDNICVNEVQSVANSLKCSLGTCSHPLCTQGSALIPACDVPPLPLSGCVKSICAVDPFCCSVSWDSICVSEVSSVCGKNCK